MMIVLEWDQLPSNSSGSSYLSHFFVQLSEPQGFLAGANFVFRLLSYLFSSKSVQVNNRSTIPVVDYAFKKLCGCVTDIAMPVRTLVCHPSLPSLRSWNHKTSRCTKPLSRHFLLFEPRILVPIWSTFKPPKSHVVFTELPTTIWHLVFSLIVCFIGMSFIGKFTITK